MKGIHPFSLILLPFLLLSLNALLSEGQETNITKGYGISPVGFPETYAHLLGFFRDVGNLPNSAVYQNGKWRDSAETSGQVPSMAATTADQCAKRNNRCKPVQEFGWRSGTELYIATPWDPVNNWSNNNSAQLYAEALVNMCSNYSAPYLFLGNENNFYYEQNETDYANWINVYNQAYDAIKAICPETIVGPTFNYESLSGNGGLNGWFKPHWEALTMHDFSRVDVIGLTVYPFFNSSHGSEVSPNYLQAMYDVLFSSSNAVTTGPNHFYPTVFTETGWPAELLGSTDLPWNCSPQEQEDYVTSMFDFVVVKDGFVPLIQWLFLNQEAGGSGSAYEDFGSVALRNSTGYPYPAYDLWLQS